jgi:hypothetical protein
MGEMNSKYCINTFFTIEYASNKRSSIYACESNHESFRNQIIEVVYIIIEKNIFLKLQQSDASRSSFP